MTMGVFLVLSEAGKLKTKEREILMKNLRLDGEIIFSIVLFLIGAAYFSATFTFEEYGGFGGYNISAKRMPQILGAAMCICAACNVQFSLVRARLKAVTEKHHDPAAVRGDIIRGLLTFVLMLTYVTLLSFVGFLVMSAIYVFFQILLLSTSEQQNYFVAAVTALASSAIVYYGFLYGFRMILPVGLLSRF
jgi:Na+/melibiose symporter-like transporter